MNEILNEIYIDSSFCHKLLYYYPYIFATCGGADIEIRKLSLFQRLIPFKDTVYKEDTARNASTQNLIW